MKYKYIERRNGVGIILNNKDRPVIDDVIKILKGLTIQEQQEISRFIEEIKFEEKQKNISRRTQQ